jgi:hypothetical protein
LNPLFDSTLSVDPGIDAMGQQATFPAPQEPATLALGEPDRDGSRHERSTSRQKSYEMPPKDGMTIAHFMVVADIEDRFDFTKRSSVVEF